MVEKAQSSASGKYQQRGDGTADIKYLREPSMCMYSFKRLIISKQAQ